MRGRCPKVQQLSSRQSLRLESTTLARDYFERAITLDPQNAEAMVGLAYARGRATFYGWSTAAEDKPGAQMDSLAKAIAIRPGYAMAYYVKSTLLWVAKKYPSCSQPPRRTWLSIPIQRTGIPRWVGRKPCLDAANNLLLTPSRPSP